MSTMAIYLIPGMKTVIELDININNNTSLGPATTYVDTEGVSHTLINGFYLENKNVGEITEITDNPHGVLYWHKKPEPNVILYISEIPGLISGCHVVSVPIHDHSSIVQGGPAYGTYFSDDS